MGLLESSCCELSNKPLHDAFHGVRMENQLFKGRVLTLVGVGLYTCNNWRLLKVLLLLLLFWWMILGWGVGLGHHKRVKSLESNAK